MTPAGITNIFWDVFVPELSATTCPDAAQPAPGWVLEGFRCSDGQHGQGFCR